MPGLMKYTVLQNCIMGLTRATEQGSASNASLFLLQIKPINAGTALSLKNTFYQTHRDSPPASRIA